MHETQEIVINTGPIIALVAATGDLRVLQRYERVYVPLEVCQEIETGGAVQFALREFEQATWLNRSPEPTPIATVLRNTLDRGEAAVIQFALSNDIQTVCIDEAVGRRAARLHGLTVTGSLGILLKAKMDGYPIRITDAISQMREHGVWLSDRVAMNALSQAGEYPPSKES